MGNSFGPPALFTAIGPRTGPQPDRRHAAQPLPSHGRPRRLHVFDQPFIGFAIQIRIDLCQLIFNPATALLHSVVSEKRSG
jgi:hypothetical protein